VRAFLLHLRNSPIRWAVPPLMVLDLAVLFLRSHYWIGVWPDAGAAAQVPAYLLGPLLAGAAAWSASAPQRHRLVEQSRAAHVRSAFSDGYRLGATTVWLVLPYLVGQATAVVVTARHSVPGIALWFGYFALGLFVTLLTVALGWTIGKCFSSIFAALTATLGCLLLLGAMDRRLGSIVVSGNPEVTVSASAIVLRLVLIVAFLVAILWLPSAGAIETGKRRFIAPVLVLLPLVAVMMGLPVVVNRQPPGRNVLCVHGAIELCIWPEHQKYQPMLQAIDTRVAALPAVFTRPSRMNEFGIENNSMVSQNGHQVYVDDPGATPTFHVIEGSTWSSAGEVSNAIMSATFEYTNPACGWDTQTDADAATLSTISAWLETYLAGGGQPDYHTDAPEAMQKAWAVGRTLANDQPLADQFTWAGKEVTELHGRHCH
jgi:hypothetical protein